METEKRKGRQLLFRTVITGFIGGLLLMIFSYFLFIFKFLEVSPKTYVIRSWTSSSWTNHWQGEVATIVIVCLLSIIVALLYFFLFKKLLSLWLSVFYGIVLWLFVGYMFSLISSQIPLLHLLDANTIVSSLCLFILYGTFIGYSISFDYKQTFFIDYFN